MYQYAISGHNYGFDKRPSHRPYIVEAAKLYRRTFPVSRQEYPCDDVHRWAIEKGYIDDLHCFSVKYPHDHPAFTRSLNWLHTLVREINCAAADPNIFPKPEERYNVWVVKRGETWITRSIDESALRGVKELGQRLRKIGHTKIARAVYLVNGVDPKVTTRGVYQRLHERNLSARFLGTMVLRAVSHYENMKPLPPSLTNGNNNGNGNKQKALPKR